MHVFDHIWLRSSQNENVSYKIVEKIQIHNLCQITFFFENPAVYEIMWKNAHFMLDTQDYKSNGIINLLNPTGHVTHQQFNIQQLYVLPTLYLFVLYLSENKQRLVPLTA